jgi:hypothetical protein
MDTALKSLEKQLLAVPQSLRPLGIFFLNDRCLLVEHYLVYSSDYQNSLVYINQIERTVLFDNVPEGGRP